VVPVAPVAPPAPEEPVVITSSGAWLMEVLSLLSKVTLTPPTGVMMKTVIARRRRKPALNRSRSVNVDVNIAGRRADTAGHGCANGRGIIACDSCFSPGAIGG